MTSPAPTPRFVIGFSVRAADGIALFTDLYLPAGAGPHPAVLLRTYLGKSRHRAEALGWAQHGFACVVQDVRGRYDSGGEWRPFWHEREDAAATLDWLAAEPWFSGRAAAIGGSYAAFTAWSAALTLQPCLQAVISAVPAMRPLDLPAAHGGILPLLGHLSWWTTHGDARCAREGLFDALLAADPGLLHHLPVATLPERMGVELPSFRDIAALDRETAPPIADDELAALRIASLHVGGWHDPFVADSLRLFELVGAAHDPRPPRQLLVGPWGHTLQAHQEAVFGERSYGRDSRFRLGHFEAEWLRGRLGTEPEKGPKTSVRVFFGGENRWLTTDAWPLPGSTLDLFAGPGGRLLPDLPADGGAASFVYDPGDPFPARRTPLDERDLLARQDRASFRGDLLAAPLRLFGTPRLELFAETDALCTDWVARLLEEESDGRLLFLSHGLIESTRHLADRGERHLPGQAQRFDLELTPIAVCLPAGHRLRLEITSSAFPSFARNPGTGASRLTADSFVKARQHIHFGGSRPTRLTLPILATDAPQSGDNEI